MNGEHSVQGRELGVFQGRELGYVTSILQINNRRVCSRGLVGKYSKRSKWDKPGDKSTVV